MAAWWSPARPQGQTCSSTLCFLGGNQRVSNLVTILKLVWLKWLVGTHTTTMVTDTYTFFLEQETRATFLVHK